MDENNRGLRKLLRGAFFYNTLQNFLGAKKFRETVIRQYFDLKPATSVLDLGCGTGEILKSLPAGISYTGIDYNPYYIAAAKETHGDKGNFICGDLTKSLTENQKFDRVLMIGFLHHLNDQAASELLGSALNLVKNGGMLISIENVRTPKQNPLAKLLMDMDRGQHVRSKEGYLSLFKENASAVETSLRTDLLWVPYSHLVMKIKK
ncbi:class I SAM-dependent methyltransferase [Bdellovibrio bacteriovorus]|uniref:class I SAM-dependent methyltransferase n=1 Tax=Bdellovibrio bacteriovorus TaxID=959 RepID=UPI0035A689C8